MYIRGKRIFITGGARRIGKEIALALSEKNPKKITVHFSSSEKEAEELAGEIKEKGVDAEIIRGDFSSQKDIERIAELAEDADIIINNASSFRKIPPEEIKFENIREGIDVNFTAHFLIIKRAWLNAKRKGKIVKVINLLDAEKVRRMFIPYHLGKNLLEYLTRELAEIFAPHLIINGVALGPIMPPEGKGEEYIIELGKKTPAGRHGKIDEVISAILFLIENDYIIGEVIHVSGGKK